MLCASLCAPKPFRLEVFWCETQKLPNGSLFLRRAMDLQTLIEMGFGENRRCVPLWHVSCAHGENCSRRALAATQQRGVQVNN